MAEWRESGVVKLEVSQVNGELVLDKDYQVSKKLKELVMGCLVSLPVPAGNVVNLLLESKGNGTVEKHLTDGDIRNDADKRLYTVFELGPQDSTVELKLVFEEQIVSLRYVVRVYVWFVLFFTHCYFNLPFHYSS